MTPEEAATEDKAYLERVAHDMGWGPDLGMSPVMFLARAGIKMRETLDSFEMMARACRHLSLATPDKVLRGNLISAVETCGKLLGEFVNFPTESAPLARQALKLQVGVEQALYRTAFREDQAKAEVEKLKAELSRTEDLISHHALGCPHVRTLPDGSKDPHYSDIFSLSDEDSYDVCTCLKNHVRAWKYEALQYQCAELKQLVLDAGDASLGGMHEKWKTRKNELLKRLERTGG